MEIGLANIFRNVSKIFPYYVQFFQRKLFLFFLLLLLIIMDSSVVLLNAKIPKKKVHPWSAYVTHGAAKMIK